MSGRLTIKDLEERLQAKTIRGFVDDKAPAGKGAKKSKYNNRKVVYDNITFDSIKEGNRYLVLRARKLAGEIDYLECHVPFELEVNGELICTYEADFVYREKGADKMTVEDVKSKMTRRLPVYRLKKKLMRECLGIEIQEV